MASFGQLSLIIVAGLCGPLLASSRRLAIPVVVGELLGGVALGKTGAGLIKPDDPSIAFLGNIGFAVLMLVAGMHVPIRNRALLGSLRGAVLAVLVTAALGVAGGGGGGGGAIGEGLDLGHPAIWAILLSTGSAAIVLPALQEAGLSDEQAIPAMAWATVADIATIVAVPLALDPSKAVRAGLGALAVAGGALVVLFVARALARESEVHKLRSQSAVKAWALDLRMALLALFALAALAQWVGTSIMIAGFAAGSSSRGRVDRSACPTRCRGSRTASSSRSSSWCSEQA
jgi:Kef-type K+ transport system membrane component KefB